MKARLRRGLSYIQELGFAPYFLVAREAAEIVREKGIPVTGRGSAANSLVCHVLGLTQLESFSNRLFFERFMHELEADVPDIDLDFCSLRRDEVCDELKGHYEEFGTAVATAVRNYLKGAVRIAARALGHTPAEMDYASPCEAGVLHIEQLFKPVELFGRVEDRGLMVDLQDGQFK